MLDQRAATLTLEPEKTMTMREIKVAQVQVIASGSSLYLRSVSASRNLSPSSSYDQLSMTSK